MVKVKVFCYRQTRVADRTIIPNSISGHINITATRSGVGVSLMFYLLKLIESSTHFMSVYGRTH